MDSQGRLSNSLADLSAAFAPFSYMLAIVAYLLFVVAIGMSRFGSIRLGPDHSRPEFSLPDLHNSQAAASPGRNVVMDKSMWGEVEVISMVGMET